MQLVDTHAHLDEDAFSTDVEDVMARAGDAGVVTILTIGITADTSRSAVALAERFDNVYAVVGIQPNYASQVQPDDWNTIEELAAHPRVVGIGETGLDRYWDYAPIEVQAEYFDRHLELSRRIDKPFVIHCRDAEADVVAQLQRAAEQGPLNGVMHSFCGDAETAAACLDLGLHISFAGMLTFKKNDELRATAATIPADRLLVETDAPYLAPVPNRGKRNEPANVVHTARCLADARGVELAEIAAKTTENARRLFRLPVV
ncbi:putative deoxyribonuclease YcfH [Maioricimonas rarisocia]|uniref:Putative deoxyribonuclease YcfH n=1 Tax=Maioricimonas rarisocia TaxID=2528026 RepID=A0A517Z5Y7_9PLAN|nr:TatD family hydrolase [Maioricimonas rarisocia]QDU37893.1 putative deoxyribonuclease YcfH [Maioricimonas rarisocia]